MKWREWCWQIWNFSIDIFPWIPVLWALQNVASTYNLSPQPSCFYFFLVLVRMSSSWISRHGPDVSSVLHGILTSVLPFYSTYVVWCGRSNFNRITYFNCEHRYSFSWSHLGCSISDWWLWIDVLDLDDYEKLWHRTNWTKRVWEVCSMLSIEHPCWCVFSSSHYSLHQLNH